MKQGTWFLKGVIFFIGIVVLTLCIFALPKITSGAAIEWPAIAPLREAILFGLYLTAIPFYFALSQAFRLLTHIDKNTAFSEQSIQALRSIKYCALTMSGLYLIGMPVIFLIAEADDAPGLIIIGFLLACSPTVVAVFAAVLQKLLQSGMELKSENELTV
ncbi:MAG: DUF2975 domain-containing protein [Candidatus Moraniibacteriota bacterium]